MKIIINLLIKILIKKCRVNLKINNKKCREDRNYINRQSKSKFKYGNFKNLYLKKKL